MNGIDILDDIEILDDFEMETFDKTAEIDPIALQEEGSGSIFDAIGIGPALASEEEPITLKESGENIFGAPIMTEQKEVNDSEIIIEAQAPVFNQVEDKIIEDKIENEVTREFDFTEVSNIHSEIDFNEATKEFDIPVVDPLVEAKEALQSNLEELEPTREFNFAKVVMESAESNFNEEKTLEEEFRETQKAEEIDALTEKTLELLNTAEILDPKVTAAPKEEKAEVLTKEEEVHSKKGMILVAATVVCLLAFILMFPYISNLIK